MMGSFLTRGLVMVFGYAYPAYECFKTVEKNKPEIEQLRFWCQYWILVAMLTVFERVGDAFVSWVPMYSEAKLAFFIYLWYPKTMGTTYVYDSFFRPYIAKHENEIDRNLLEIRTRAGDIAVLYWQRAASYGQTRVFEILQYIASQSPSRPSSRPRPTQQDPGVHQPPPAARAHQPPTSTMQLQPQQLPSHSSSTGTGKSTTQQQQQPSRTSSTGTTQQQHEPVQDIVPLLAPLEAPAESHAQTTDAAEVQAAAQSSGQSTQNRVEAMEIEAASSLTNSDVNPPVQETIVEEAIRVTRARLRKNRSAANR